MLAKNPKQTHPWENGPLQLKKNVTLKGTSVIIFFQICTTIHRKTACMFSVFHYYNTNTVQSRKVAAEIKTAGCMPITPYEILGGGRCSDNYYLLL